MFTRAWGDFAFPTDIPAAAAAFPELNFVIFHCCFRPACFNYDALQDVRSGRTRDGVPDIKDTTEFAQLCSPYPNVYAEIGSAFAVSFLQSPEAAAHLIGQLLKEFGSRRILWGTDSIWWGSPQWQIDAFKTLVIPAQMQEEFGYPPLTAKAKARILGLNAARLYGVRPRRRRCTVPDAIDRLQEAQGGFREARSLRAYGPRTRREFLALLRHTAGGLA